MRRTFFSLLLVLSFASCQHATRAPERACAACQPVRNLILIIGDGMGPQQLGLALSYARHTKRQLHLERFLSEASLGLVLTGPGSGLVTDSAASASQLSSGLAARPETVGLDMSGKPAETILEKAMKLGKSAGLVTDVRLTDGTPAAFAAHVSHRGEERKIAAQLVESRVDVLLGGGAKHFSAILLECARKGGYELLSDRGHLSRASSQKVLGLFAGGSLADGITHRDTKEDSTRTVPSLEEMAGRAIELLERNEKGFFLMVEAGQIDWAGHQNDAGLMLQEMLKLDETVGTVLEWAGGRSDTLVLLLGDHETGSFGLSYFAGETALDYGEPAVLDLLAAQKKSLEEVAREFDALAPSAQTTARLIELIHSATGITLSHTEAKTIFSAEADSFYPDSESKKVNRIARALAPHQHVVWGTSAHTGTPIVTAARGPKAVRELFTGVKTMPEIGLLLQRALGVE